MLGEIGKFGQLLLVDHVETARRADCQHDAQVKQVVLFQFDDRIVVDACTHDVLVLLVQAVVLVDQVTELVFQQLRLVREVLNFPAAHELAQTEMLVKRRRRLIFALQDVAKARAEPDLTPSIEHYLRARQVRMRHVVVMQRVNGAQN